MSGFVPKPLQALLGPDLVSIDAAALARLVGVEESEWLDAKRELYPATDAGARELALDVAAFANSGGGLIVVGLDENGFGRVSSLHPVEETAQSDEALRMTQIISSRVSPVPSFEVRRVEASGERVFLVVAVMSSSRSPHSVAIDGSKLRYPKRVGAHRRDMTESEVAEQYRRRFEDARSHLENAAARHESFVKILDRTSRAWLVVSMEPHLGGEFRLDHSKMESVKTCGIGRFGSFPSCFGRTSFQSFPAFLSVRLTEFDHSIRSTGAILQFDGGGSFGYGWDERPLPFEESNRRSVTPIADEDLFGCILNGTSALVRWATEFVGLGGDATLQVEIYSKDSTPVAVCQFRSNMQGRLQGSRDIEDRSGLSRRTISLDGAFESGEDLVSIARQVSAELLGSFGVIGPLQVDETGSLKSRYFHRDKLPWLEQWASNAGVNISDEPM